jgi:general secretion pathway protein A
MEGDVMYKDFFGLQVEPFNITPDPKFVYFTEKHRYAFAKMLYGIEHRKGFICITGEIGAGKTMLCRVLLDHLGKTVKSALIVNPNLSDSQLLAAIVEDLGIEVARKNKKSYFDALNSFLVRQSREGSTTVIILDEAQNLRPKSMEQIRMLSNVETNEEKLLQIVLVGQPELAAILARPSLAQLQQRINIRVHLVALDRAETEEYVLHRLRVAGGEGRSFFEPGCFDFIHQYSNGRPRLINVLCDNAMLLAYLKQVPEVTLDMLHSAHQDMVGFLPSEEAAKPEPVATPTSKKPERVKPLSLESLSLPPIQAPDEQNPFVYDPDEDRE